MAKFELYEDRKYTKWIRTIFSVEAKDEQEALDIAKSFHSTPIEDIIDDRIEYHRQYYLLDRMEIYCTKPVKKKRR